ncbi:MAG: VOC family protein [Gammaproteobacteria bacterium]
MKRRTDLGLDHVAIPVRDAAATHDFYAEVLGLPLLEAYQGNDWGGFPWLMMIFAAADDRQLAFIAFKGGKEGKSNLPGDARHYAFSLATKAQLAAWRTKLAAARIKFVEEDHGAQQSLYFEDPNGITLEITAPPSAKGAKPNPHAVDTIAAWAKRQR